MRATLQNALPARLLSFYRRARLSWIRRQNRSRSLEEVFTDVYRRRLWGEGSGSGSRGPAAEAYARLVRDFVVEHCILSVVDIGCGDFYVASHFLDGRLRYVGIDVVPDLIATNRRRFGRDTVQFNCLDACTAALPDADLCLVRQVLQHLSNDQIRSILSKLTKYKYVIVTEHYPAPGHLRMPNLDKPHGADIRLYDGSAVYLDHPPFNTAVDLLLEVAADPVVCAGETIRSFLLRQ